MPVVNSKSEKLLKLFKKKIVVPEYQRPASWDATKIQRLFWSFSEFVKRSAEEANDVFYLGEFVTEGERKIVDGQQRMIAFTVFCAAMRDAAISCGEVRKAAEFQKFLRGNGGSRLFRTDDEEADRVINYLQNPIVEFDTGYKLQRINSPEVTIRRTRAGNADAQVNSGDWLEFRKEFSGESIRFQSPKLFGLNEQGGARECVLSGFEDIAPEWVGSKLYYSRVEINNDLINHNIFVAYRRIYSEFLSWYSELLFDCQQRSKTLKLGENKITFSSRNSQYGLSPISLNEGERVMLSYLYNNERENLEVELTKNTQRNSNLNLTFELTADQLPPGGSKKVKFLEAKLPRNDRGVALDKFKKKLFSTLVVITNFESAGPALDYFTISNNGNNREPLWNFDLLHALVYEMRSSGRISDQRQQMLNDAWKNIRSIVFDRKVKLKDRMAQSENFIRRYMLAKGILDSNNKQFESETKAATVKKFGALSEKWRADESLYSPGESWSDRVVDIVLDMEKFCQALEFCSDPRLVGHPDWLSTSYDATSKALLYTMKRFEFDIHYPLVAELLVRFDSQEVEGRNGLLQNLLKGLLSRITRNFLFRKNLDILPDNFIPLTPQEIYGLYRLNENGYIALLNSGLTPAEIVEAVIQTTENYFTKKVDSGDGVDHCLSTILDHCLVSGNFVESESKKICFLAAFCDDRVTNIKLIKKDRMIDWRLARDEMEPDIEHVLPKTWRAKEDDQALGEWEKWPAFTKEDHQRIVNSPGNMTPLEYKFNRGFDGHSLFYKSGVRECPFNGMHDELDKTYRDSEFPSIGEIRDACSNEENNLEDVWNEEIINRRLDKMKTLIVNYFG
jgi:hypothetical protein